MIKPRKISALIKRVLDADPGAGVSLEVLSEAQDIRRLHVNFKSVLAYSELKDSIDLSVVNSGILPDPTANHRAFMVWDCSKITFEQSGEIKPFAFDGRDEALNARRVVNEQEEDTAALIDGRRHVGSGAIEGLKSDASSDTWQAESKSTVAKSLSLKLDVLDKISREAREQNKKPMVHVRFTNVPQHMIVSEDWVVLTGDEFERLRGMDEK